jgi:hypothetical protein
MSIPPNTEEMFASYMESFIGSIDCNFARILSITSLSSLLIAVSTTLMIEYFIKHNESKGRMRGDSDSSKGAPDKNSQFEKSHRTYMTMLMDSLVLEEENAINYNSLLETIEYLEDHPNQIDLVLCAEILCDPLQPSEARENAYCWLKVAKTVWKADPNAIMFSWFANETVQYSSPPRSRAASS